VADADDCKYVCDGGGGGRVALEGEAGVVYGDLKCITCDGVSGTQGQVFTGDGQHGDVNDATPCTFTCASDGTTSQKVFDPSGNQFAQVNCYMCDATHAQPDIAQPVDGLGGNASSNAPCAYVCDGEGSKIYTAGVNSQPYDAFKCYTCDPASDTPDDPENVEYNRADGNHSQGEEGTCRYDCTIVDGVSRKQYADNGILHAALNCYTCDASLDTPNTTPLPTEGTSGNAPGDADCTYTCKINGNVSTLQYAADGSPYSAITGCYDCDGADDPVPVDGEYGNTANSEADSCRYTCDSGEKVHEPVSADGLRYGNLNCYLCSGESAPDPLTGITDSNHAGAVSGADSCKYWCEGGSVSVVSDDDRDNFDITNARNTSAEVNCYSCSGDPGPDSSCVTVDDHIQGAYRTESECDTDAAAQCGWGYECVGDDCAISADAARGRSHQDCKMDSDVRCGWKFGCFNKYACVDGTSCAAVPEHQCVGSSDADGTPGTLSCYDSAEVCMSSTSCVTSVLACYDPPVSGEWFLSGNSLQDDAYVLNVNTTFIEDAIVDGYQWYKSSATFTLNGETFNYLEIGIKETFVDTGRIVELKFRGNYLRPKVYAMGVWIDASKRPFHSAETGADTYENPAAIEIAAFALDDTDCFELDSLNLTQLNLSSAPSGGVGYLERI
jgi:hypothetical protein